MRKMNPALSGLLDLHDRGVIELPGSVVAARERYAAAMKMSSPEVPRNDMAAEVVAALHAGESLDIEQAAADFVKQRDAAGVASRALYDAREVLAEQLDNSIIVAAEEILTESLRPAHDKIIGELRANVDAAAPLVGDPLLAPKPVRDALANRAELVELYGEICTAADRLKRITAGEPKHDHDNNHLRIRNPELFAYRLGNYVAGRTIPANVVERITAGAEHWLPLVAEQDALFLEKDPRYADRVRSDIAAREQVLATAAIEERRRAELRAAGAVGPGMDRPDPHGIPYEG